MSLASDQGANSVVALSKSPCYHYQYSSISKVLSAPLWSQAARDPDAVSAWYSTLVSLTQSHWPKAFGDFWLLNTDSSSLFRPYSPTLPDRSYVYKPNNRVAGNRPVDVGYRFSTIGLSARSRSYGGSGPPWNLPLDMQLIPYEAHTNSFTAAQVNALLDQPDLPFGQDLVLNALDSNYASPEYIAQTHHQTNLVNVIRLASNRKVWRKLSRAQSQARRQANADQRGANAVYGQKYKLSEVEQWDLPPDQAQQLGIKLGNGRKVELHLSCWEQMMIRTKRGLSMKDKPFRLMRVQLRDPQSGKLLFKRAMWLGIWGQRREEPSLEQIYWAYRHRFDIEHFLRFGKQNLLLDSFQTPDQQHLQNWLRIVTLAYWLLWVAKEEASYRVPKWQQYDPTLKKRKQLQLSPSPAQVQYQLATIILGVDQTPFLPKPQIKTKGRVSGTTFSKRPRYPLRKKGQKRKKAVP